MGCSLCLGNPSSRELQAPLPPPAGLCSNATFSGRPTLTPPFEAATPQVTHTLPKPPLCWFFTPVLPTEGHTTYLTCELSASPREDGILVQLIPSSISSTQKRAQHTVDALERIVQ